MNNKVVKILSILMVLVMVFSTLSPVFAEIIIPSSSDGDTGSDAALAAQDIGNIVLGVVQVISGFAAVILLVVLAIKYMTASPEGKADIKKTAIIYVVGAAVLFGSTWILNMLQTTFNRST